LSTPDNVVAVGVEVRYDRCVRRWALGLALVLGCTQDNPVFGTSALEAMGTTTTQEVETSSVESSEEGGIEDGGTEDTGQLLACDELPAGRQFDARITGSDGEQLCETTVVNGRLIRNDDGSWTVSCDPDCGACELGATLTMPGVPLPALAVGCVDLVAAFWTPNDACIPNLVTITREGGMDIVFAGGDEEVTLNPIGDALFRIRPQLQRACDCPGEIGECCPDTPGMYSLDFQTHGVELAQGEVEIIDTAFRRLRVENLRSQVAQACAERPMIDWFMLSAPD
jgi:hypothetical protein